MSRPLKVAVVGCGVAGLTSAVILARHGHHVTLIERAPRLAPVGGGVVASAFGATRGYAPIGLLDQVVADAEPIDGLHALTHRRRTLVRLSYRKLGPDLAGYGVHRGDLFNILHDQASRFGATFQLGTTIVASRESMMVQSSRSDETGQSQGSFDVLIAADGARSRLRADPRLGARVREFPLGAAWFSGRSDAVRGRLHQVTRGSRQLIGMLPVGRGRCSLFCALPRDGIESLRAGGLDALKREIFELCPEAQSLVAQIQSPADFATARYQIANLKRWSAGRLVCIGDAAHSTTPHLGQGVNLAAPGCPGRGRRIVCRREHPSSGFERSTIPTPPAHHVVLAIVQSAWPGVPERRSPRSGRRPRPLPAHPASRPLARHLDGRHHGRGCKPEFFSRLRAPAGLSRCAAATSRRKLPTTKFLNGTGSLP